MKIPIQLIVAVLLVACGKGSDQHSIGMQAVDPLRPTSLPAVSEPKFSAAQVELGRTLHAKILDKYPRLDRSYRKPRLWGSMTSQPVAMIGVPTKDWQKLSKEDKDCLEAYAASLVDEVRASPMEFQEIPESAPIAPMIRENAAAMTSNSWGIMIGAISPDGRDLMADDFAVKGTGPIEIATTTSMAPPESSRKDPVAEAAESKKALDQIETRFKENAARLKKYYATADQLRQGTDDLIHLAVVEGYYANSKSKDEKALSQRSSRLTARVSQQQRELYASTVEEVLVKNGMDARVSATGSDKTQLRLKYALMSQPLVYKFQNEIGIDEQARFFGFKKIIYTNGFDSSLGETWTVALKSSP